MANNRGEAKRGTVQYQHSNTGGVVAGAARKVAFKSTREGECRQVEKSLSLSLSEKTFKSRTCTTTKQSRRAGSKKKKKKIRGKNSLKFKIEEPLCLEKQKKKNDLDDRRGGKKRLAIDARYWFSSPGSA